MAPTGIGASVQYREREIVRVNYGAELQFGEYLPLLQGTPIPFREAVDPRIPFPFEPGAANAFPGALDSNFDSTTSKTLALNLSAAWNIGSHTNLRADYQHFGLSEDRFKRSSRFDAQAFHNPVPIAALGGEVRSGLTFGGSANYNTTYIIEKDGTTDTDVFSFRGDSTFGRFQANYSLGYTKGSKNVPSAFLGQRFRFSVPITSDILLIDRVTDPVENRIISIFGPRTGSDIPLPLLTQAGFDLFNDPSLGRFSSAQFDTTLGENDRYTGEIGLRYNSASDFLKYVHVGVAAERSTFRNRLDDILTLYNRVGAGPTFAQLGLDFDEPGFGAIGIDNGFRVISRADMEAFLLGGGIEAVDPSLITRTVIDQGNSPVNDEFTREVELAPFVQGRIDVGDFELIGGVRVSRVKINAANFNSPTILDESFVSDLEFKAANSALVTQRAVQTAFLPRILINYRPRENLVFRLGYFESVARPQINLLSQTPSISLFLAPFFGPNGNQPALFVQQGNPELQPARTRSLDFGAEYYDRSIGVIKLNLFYKRISNLLEFNTSKSSSRLDEVDLPDDPRFDAVLANPDAFAINFTAPENNPDIAEIWGLEAVFERQFTFLPGFMSGFGVIANYTYTDSSKNQPFDWNFAPTFAADGSVVGFTSSERIIFEDLPFNNQPRHSGSIALTYNKYGIDANIAYTMQSRRPVSTNVSWNLIEHEEAFQTLDARFEYRFGIGGTTIRAYVEGTDLLRSYEDPSLERTTGGVGDTPKFFSGGSFFGGRQVRVGLTASF